MRLFICLAAWLLLAGSQAARIARGIESVQPHIHAIHHGYGATSYQNVQVENYGSVPIPTEDHHHYHHHQQHHHELVEKHHVIRVLEEPRYAHHEGHLEVPVVIATDPDHHLQEYIILEKDIHAVPLKEVVPIVEREDEKHYAHVEQVAYVGNGIQHVQVHESPTIHYQDNHYGHDVVYDYH